MATLHIIQGFLGAGKSTFSKKLAQENDAIIYNPDEWVEIIFTKDEFLANWNKCFDETVNILWKNAKNMLLSGKDVIFDMGFWDKQSRDNAKEFATKLNVGFKHYYVYAPDDILKERISLRSGEIAERNLKNFEKLKENFVEPKDDEEVIVIKNF